VKVRKPLMGGVRLLPFPIRSIGAAPDLARAQVIDDPLAVRLFPFARRFKPRIQLADRLVADVE